MKRWKSFYRLPPFQKRLTDSFFSKQENLELKDRVSSRKPDK